MTEERAESLSDASGMIGESDAVDGEPTLPKGEVNQVNVSVGECLPTLGNESKEGDVECMENDATTVPDMANAVDANAQCSTSVQSNTVCDDVVQSAHEDAKPGTNILEIDVQNISQSFTPELLESITIDVDVNGRLYQEKANNDYVMSSRVARVMSANAKCFRAKVNTPASLCADFPELVPFNARSSHGLDGAYHHAMTLMSERCPNEQRIVTRTPLISLKTPPVGTYTPRYFFVEQNRPTPMNPLKVWRGYQGNVYFEPIHVNRANYIVPEPPPTPAIENYSDTLQQIMKRNKRKHHSPPRSVARNSTAASEAAAGSTVDENAASHRGSPVVKGQRKMALLDESAILDGENEALREDIIWLVGQQSIGSLCINESTSSKRVPPYQKHRICKGSVAHKIYALRNKEIPLLSLKSGTSRSGAASPKAPTPRGPVDSIQTSYNSFPELSVLRSRRKAQSSQEDGTHDLISARPPALERMNFEDGALHFSARPFPSCGLLGKVRTSRNVSPRRPQHRVS